MCECALNKCALNKWTLNKCALNYMRSINVRSKSVYKRFRWKMTLISYGFDYFGFNFCFTVEEPTAKTTISVMEVTVMATPACFMVWPIFCGILFSCRSELFKLSKLCMITNMSSIPAKWQKIRLDQRSGSLQRNESTYWIPISVSVSIRFWLSM